MTSDHLNPDSGQTALTDALEVSFRALRFAMGLLLIGYLLSGIYIVGQHEKAMVLVFGKLSGMAGERVKSPGLYWTFPRPISEIIRIPTERVQSIATETFWRDLPQTPDGLPAAPATGPLKPGQDGYALTADSNLIHSRWILRYRIGDPIRYRFGFADLEAVLAREIDHAIVRVSGRFPIDQALRTNIEAFRAAVDRRLRDRIAQLDLGIAVVGLEIAGLIPPQQVAAAFNAVVAAEQERSQQISAARGYAARALNEAQGDAARLVAEGEAYRRRVVSEVSAEADYFRKVRQEYRKNPRVIAGTLLQASLRRVLEQVDEKFILGQAGRGRQELRLQLNPEPTSPWVEGGE